MIRTWDVISDKDVLNAAFISKTDTSIQNILGPINFNGAISLAAGLSVTGNAAITGTVTWSGGGSANANFAYAQTSYLGFSTEATEYADIFSLPSTVVQGAEKGKLKGATHQNLVKNGNFANGTTGFSAGAGVLSGTTYAIVTSNGTGNNAYLIKSFPFISGHEYFLISTARVTNADCTNFSIRAYATILKNIVPVQNTWNVLYGKFTATTETDIRIRMGYVDAATANGKVMEVTAYQVIDLTAEGLTSLTEYQLAQKFSHYIAGMQSVQPQEILSRGKNLFDKGTLEIGTIGGDGANYTSTASCRTNKFYGIKPNTTYRTTTEEHYVNFYDRYRNYISRDYKNAVSTFTTPANAYYIRLTFINKLADNIFFDTFQLEEGSTATTYEPYQESKAYLKYPLRSVPNGACDEVDLQSGKLIKRCEEYALQSGDISYFEQADSNIDRFRITSAVLSGIKISAGTNYKGEAYVEGFIEKSYADSVDNVNTYFTSSVSSALWICVAKGTYADLAAAQAALAGTKIVYQLAQEQVIEDALSNSLTVYPSGTVSLMPKKQYVLKAEDVVFRDTGFTAVDTVLTRTFTETSWTGSGSDSVEIINDDIVWKQMPNAGISNVNNIGKFALRLATQDIMFIIAKGAYASLAEAQADLAGTIITYDTKPELSTIPVTVHSEPINLAGAVKSESDRNTRQDEVIRGHINSTGADHSYLDQSVTTTATPTFSGVKTPMIDHTAPVHFLNGSSAQGINIGQLLISNIYADVALVPANGMYSKGDIKTAGGLTTGNKIIIDKSVAGDGGWDDCAVILKNNHATAGECSFALQNILTGANYWKMGLNQNSSLAFNYGTAFLDAGTIMTITADGKVGIGEVYPGEMLTIGAESTTATARKAIRINSGGYGEPAAYNTASNGDKIILYDNVGHVYDARIGVGSYKNLWFKSSSNTATTGVIEFYTGSAPSMRMKIAGDGCVGIGTITPQYSLDISCATNYKHLRLGGAGIPLIKFANPNYNSGNGAEIWQDNSGVLKINSNSTTNVATIDTIGTMNLANAVQAPLLAVTTTNGTSGGISLYGGVNYTTKFGLAFRKTTDQGTHGYVTGDWATYFFLDNTAGRGWVFRNSTAGNVASIDNTGRATMKSYRTGNFEMVHNTTENSLDFIYFG